MPVFTGRARPCGTRISGSGNRGPGASRSNSCVPTPSVCTGCSNGCNVYVESRGNVIYRLLPRRNEEVNQVWMCDEGRLTHHETNDNRLEWARTDRGEEAANVGPGLAVEEADSFVAVTEGDNRNIMAAQIAKQIYKVPRVVCRIYDPIREEAYRKLGLEVFCPTIEGSRRVRQMLMARK